jgi:hypothetical protein
LKVELKWHPYKLKLVQQLSPNDYVLRVAFARKISQEMGNDSEFLHNLFFSDEAHFHLDGAVNHHNFRYWSDENPHWHAEVPLHSQRVTVWMGIGFDGWVGPFFFTETVNAQRYLTMLQEQVIPALQHFPRFNELIFMQDGAPPHWATSVRNLLNATFPMRWMGRGSPAHPWPPRSPDITPMDYFYWGYLKSRIYQGRAFESLDVLRQKIVHECHAMHQDTIRRSIVDFSRRLQECITRKGQSVEK